MVITNPRECAICATVETSENKMLFLSDIYDKHPYMPCICSCATTCCSDCILSTVNACVIPDGDEDDDTVFGDKILALDYKCPFCRTVKVDFIPSFAWDSGRPLRTSNSLPVIFSEAMKAIKGEVKEKKIYPKNMGIIFENHNAKQRIITRYTMVARYLRNKEMVAIALKPRFVLQHPCCEIMCRFDTVAEFGSGVYKLVEISVCSPPRRSKRVVDECTTKNPKRVKVD